MKCFKLIATNVDTRAIVEELTREAEAWFQQTGRQQGSFAQRHTNAIPLRGLRKSKVSGRRRRDVHESRYTGLSAKFPVTVAFIERFAREQGGTLGRAKLALLPAGKEVLPHVDRGEYYRRRDRYHLVIRSAEGSMLRAGGEEVRMRAGELWWFDNKALHSAANRSAEDRIHLIFDVLPNTPKAGKNTLPDPVAALQQARNIAEESAIEVLAAAVGTYTAICAKPEPWRRLLAKHGLEDAALRSPLSALAELHWPDVKPSKRRRYESALAWALAQIDMGLIAPDGVAAAIRKAGGIDALDVLWRNQPEDELYAELIAAEAARESGPHAPTTR